MVRHIPRWFQTGTAPPLNQVSGCKRSMISPKPRDGAVGRNFTRTVRVFSRYSPGKVAQWTGRPIREN
jgi:hypothetical protein